MTLAAQKCLVDKGSSRAPLVCHDGAEKQQRSEEIRIGLVSPPHRRLALVVNFRRTSAAAKDVDMSGPTDPTNEFSELIKDNSTPALLRKALELFIAADPKLARDAADKLDELCERRFAMARTEGEKAYDASIRPNRTELNDRCDALTGRLMKYLGKLVAEQERIGGSQLVLFAAARSFICTSASVSGVEEGLASARLIFEETFRELTPMLREMSGR